MKKLSFIILLFIGIASSTVNAQDALTLADGVQKSETGSKADTEARFEFNAFPREFELEPITESMAGDHVLGTQIAKKMYLLQTKYTSEVELVPGNPQTKTVIAKPEIYDAVMKIEKYLRKELKKGLTTTEAATYSMNKVLDVALNVRNSNTEKLEAAIEKLDTPQQKLDLFTNRITLIY